MFIIDTTNGLTYILVPNRVVCIEYIQNVYMYMSIYEPTYFYREPSTGDKQIGVKYNILTTVFI